MKFLGSFKKMRDARAVCPAQGLLILCGVISVGLYAQVGRADQDGMRGATLSEMVPGPREHEAVAKEHPTTRQNDDRLPPVLPGEEVITESGQRMRVWSSAGPVPVNNQPTPTTLNGGSGGPAVIIDGRNPSGIGPVGDRVR